VRALAIIVFGLGFWAATMGPTIVSHLFGIGRAMRPAELEFGIEVTALSAAAATFGYAFVRGATVPRAAFAIPFALALLYVVPGRAAMWLSETFRSVLVNTVALAITFALVGYASGWMVSRCFAWWEARHA
jgi:hypothetical protein